MTSTSSQTTRLRYSLTWRVIALSSLLLLVLVALFIWLGRSNLNYQLEESRVAHHERQQREIHLAMQHSADNLRQLASLMAAAPDLGNALLQNNPAAIEAALSAQWPSAQLDSGVDEIFIFDSQGQLAGTNDASAPGNELPVQRWINDILTTESPITTLRCATDCQQFAAVPMLVEGQSIGMVVLARSLADVIRKAREVSASEVALIIAGAETSQETQDERQLSNWNGRIIALTGQEKMLPLLHLAASETPMHRLVEAPFSFNYLDQNFELSAVYMEHDADWRSSGYFLLISNITKQVSAIQSATKTLLIVGIIGWLAAELSLLAILLGPMARLRRVAALLPAIAHGDFERVRSRLPASRSLFSNEIDILEGSTRDLSYQLEMLQTAVQERSDQLAERISDLAKERDFMNSLLDTAQVFIVVQDSLGYIQLTNTYTREILGLEGSTLLGRRFYDVFDNDPVSTINHFSIEASPTGSTEDALKDARYSEEKTLQAADKRLYTVAWYHAPLANSDNNHALISVGLDITDRKAAEARLMWLAEHDPLTELFNRHHFQNALQEALLHHTEGAILLLDLDRFKEINELSGHHIGDRLLCEVAETLLIHLGHRSTIARLGGDEYALLLSDITSEQAIKVAEYITQLLDAMGFTTAGRKHHVAASIGIALFHTHGKTAADLLASADTAMYKAKESSSQHWYLLSQAENAKDELQKRVYWVERLHNALKTDSFELMAQPIVRLEDADIKHYEVLLRMRNADGSLVSPSHFISIAEQSGLVVHVDRWVVRHSLKMLKQLQHRGISLAVNLSGQSLHDPGLQQYLIDELKRSGADPKHLILEVTETAAITDFSTARNVLQGVRDLGCRIALDDFGIGFSSFHYLGQLPVDYIKIDGSFISSLLTNPDSHTIVKAIADIASGFGKQTIAEFADQEALLPILRSYNITYGQGFHLGKPDKLSLL